MIDSGGKPILRWEGLAAQGVHEPTAADLQRLLGLLDRLADAGESVIVIEHHQP